MKFRTMKKRGAALPLAIFCGILLIGFSGILLTTVNNEMKINKVSQERIIAKNLAEAAIEDGLYEYNNIISKEEKFKDFQNDGSIDEIGIYTYSYKAPEKVEKKIATFIGEGTTMKGNKYKIIAKLEIESGKIIEWKEDK